MEIYPGLHRIESIVGGRRLRQFFLAARSGVLIDAGEPQTPEAAILPYLDRIGVAPDAISLVVVTHADTDHHGGLAAIRRAAPRATISCGFADKRLIENPELLVRERYRAYEADDGIGYAPEALENLRGLEQVAVERCWRGGERLRVDEGWEIEIVPTPGHSDGHVSVLDRRYGALFCGDAVHGSGYPDVAGRPVLPPNYIDVDAYRLTIERIRQCRPFALHGAHWPAASQAEVDAFLNESARYADELEEIVLRRLEGSDAALAALVDAVRLQRSEWRDTEAMDLAYSVAAHLRRLEAEGRVTWELKRRVRVHRLRY